MADFIHTHGAPKCRPGRHHPSCKHHNWSWICGPKKCIHLDPGAPGGARTLKLVKALGLKVMKGRKPSKRKVAAKKRKR
jgi:hypothetical protein